MKFSIENKTFKGDIETLFNLLKNKKKFAFSKYADGEYEILINNKITNCDAWTFEPGKHDYIREELLKSYKFNQKGYFVGISCPCCQPINKVNWMKENVGVPNEQLTWANIFVNSNYQYFLDNFLPEFNKHKIILVANENAKIDNLPFKVEEHIGITNNAFIDNFDLVKTMPQKDYKNKLFLFCAGPLGNMLAANMWKKNKKNTYLDIGSTLNSYLIGQKNRGYLKGGKSINKICIW